MVGAVGGWVIELFFRRIFSTKKWINPGFLNGPYLPMYGCGTLLLYGACFIPLPRWALVLVLIVALTLLEYITGLIFIKGMKIKLWDYSNQWGNIQGIICPLFSLLWGCIAAGFVYLLFEPLHTAAVWAAGSGWMHFFNGAFYGVFFRRSVHKFQRFAEDPQGCGAVQGGGALRRAQSRAQRTQGGAPAETAVPVPLCRGLPLRNRARYARTAKRTPSHRARFRPPQEGERR